MCVRVHTCVSVCVCAYVCVCGCVCVDEGVFWDLREGGARMCQDDPAATSKWPLVES